VLLIHILLLGALEQVPFWWAVVWGGGTLLGLERRCECLPCLGLAQTWPPCPQGARTWHGAGAVHPTHSERGCSDPCTGSRCPPLPGPTGQGAEPRSEVACAQPWPTAGAPGGTGSGAGRFGPVSSGFSPCPVHRRQHRRGEQGRGGWRCLCPRRAGSPAQPPPRGAAGARAAVATPGGQRLARSMG